MNLKDLETLAKLRDNGIITEEEFTVKKAEILNINVQSAQTLSEIDEKNMFEWYKDCWKKYAVFEGRAIRSEYWYFYLVNILVTMAIGLVEASYSIPQIISGAYSLAVLLPSLAVAFRRLHDVGKSGVWVFVPIFLLIPVIVGVIITVSTYLQGMVDRSLFNLGLSMTALSGFALIVVNIYIFILLCTKGDEKPNEYGPPII